MAGASFQVEIDDAAARAALARLVELGADLTPAMDEIGGMLETSTQMRFERGESPSGEPWPPSIRAIAEHGKTLIDSARLMQSITHQAARDRVRVGTNVIYAAVQQKGAVISSQGGYLKFRIGDRWVQKRQVEIPARPFLGVSEDDRREIVAILRERLVDAWIG